MATATKKYSWASTVEGWTFVSGGDAVSDYLSGTGNPAGSIGMTISGRKATDTSYWYIADTWENIFGIPSNAHVTSIKIKSGYDYTLNWNVGDDNTIGPIKLQSSNGTTDLATVLAGRYVTAADSGWNTISEGTAQTFNDAVYGDATDTIRLHIEATMLNGNNASASMETRWDEIEFEIVYEINTGNQSSAPGNASITAVGYLPTISGPASDTVVPNQAALTTTGYAPTIDIAAAPADVTVFPDTGAIVVTGYAPPVITAIAVSRTVEPAVGGITLTGQAPSCAVETYTIFHEYPVDEAPDDWSDIWEINGTEAVIEESTTILNKAGKKSLKLTSTAGSRTVLTWNEAGENLADVDIIAKIDWESGDIGANGFIVAGRISGTSSTKNFYGVRVRSGYVDIARGLNGAYTYLSQVDGDLSTDPTQPCRGALIRLQIVGTTIRCKVWDGDSLEPVEWLLTATDSNLTSGKVGVCLDSSSVSCNVDYFNCTSDGSAAINEVPAEWAGNFGRIGWSASVDDQTNLWAINWNKPGQQLRGFRLWVYQWLGYKIRVAVYQGGTLTDPSGATLLYDFGAVGPETDTYDDWRYLTCSPITLPDSGVLWVAIRAEGNGVGTSAKYSKTPTGDGFNAGNYYHTGDLNNCGVQVLGTEEISSDVDVAFPATIPTISTVTYSRTVPEAAIQLLETSPIILAYPNELIVTGQSNIVFSDILPLVGGITLTGGDAPTVIIGITNVTVTPANAVITSSGLAPTIVGENTISAPGIGGITLAGQAPTIAAMNVTVVPAAASISVAGLDLVIDDGNTYTGLPGSAGITITGQAPTIASLGVTVAPGVVGITATGQTPTISNEAASGHRYWRFMIVAGAGGVTSGFECSAIEFRETIGGADACGSGTPSTDYTYPGYDIADAFDGSSTTWWKGNLVIETGSHWVKYDFGAGNLKDINEIRWQQYNDCDYVPSDARLQYSDDDSTWYDKIHFWNQYSNGANSEQLYNSRLPDCLEAQDLIAKPMTSDSSLGQVTSGLNNYANPWGAAVYGNQLFWGSNDATDTWWKIDLGSAKTVKALGYTGWSASGYLPKNFKLQGSNNDSDWTDVLTYKNDHELGLIWHYLFNVTSPGSYRYYRIWVTDLLNQYSKPVFAEVVFYDQPETSSKIILPAAGTISALGEGPAILGADSVDISGAPFFIDGSLTYNVQSLQFVGGSLIELSPQVAVTDTIILPAQTGITVTGQAPTINVTGHVTVVPGVSALTISGQTPLTIIPEIVEPSYGEILTIGYAPTIVIANVIVEPSYGTIFTIGQAPTLAAMPVAVDAGAGAVVLNTFAPTVSGESVTVIPGTGSITAAGVAPTMLVDEDIVVEAVTGSISIIGYAATVVASDNKTVVVSNATLTINGQAVTAEANLSVAVGPGTITVNGQAVTLSLTEHVSIIVAPGEITASGQTPVLGGGIPVGTAELTITGQTPVIDNSFVAIVAEANLVISGQGVSLFAPTVITVDPANMIVTGRNVLYREIAPTPGFTPAQLAPTPQPIQRDPLNHWHDDSTVEAPFDVGDHRDTDDDYHEDEELPRICGHWHREN